MGNFFPMMVMALFDVFWLSFGVLQLPTLQLGAPYATDADPTGTASPQFNAAIALYLIVWGFALLTFFFFTLKINVVFASIFGLVTVAAFVLSGAYWKVSQGEFDDALKLQKVRPPGVSPLESHANSLSTGRRCVDIRGRPAGLVRVFYHHVCGNESADQLANGRPQPPLATDRRRDHRSRSGSSRLSSDFAHVPL